MFRFKLDLIEKGSLSNEGYDNSKVLIKREIGEDFSNEIIGVFKIDLSNKELSIDRLRSAKLRIYIKSMDIKNDFVSIEICSILNNIQLLSELKWVDLKVKSENIKANIYDSPYDEYIEFDITRIFKGWIDNPKNNNGLAIFMPYDYGNVEIDNGINNTDILIEYSENNEPNIINLMANEYMVEPLGYRGWNERIEPGPTGATGSTGAKGDTGATGITGATGPAIKLNGIVAIGNSGSGTISANSEIPFNVVQYTGSSNVQLVGNSITISKVGTYLVDWWIQTASAVLLTTYNVSLMLGSTTINTIRATSIAGVSGNQYGGNAIIQVTTVPIVLKLVSATNINLYSGGTYAQMRVVEFS